MSPSLRVVAVAASVGAVLAFALPAFAAPARTGVLSASAPKYEWEDPGPVQSAGTDVANPAPMCSPGFPCDDTLVEIKDAGRLEFAAASTGEVRPDVDIYLYKSDASGTAGSQVAAGETPDAAEKIRVNVQPGWFLLRTAYFSGLNMSYKGSATLTPPVVAKPAPPPGPGTVAAGNKPPAITLGAFATKVKKLRAFSGSASDDNAVSKVEVGLLWSKGKRCSQLTASGRLAKAKSCKTPTVFVPAKGTNPWKLELRKRLPKGSYLLVARAVDAEGLSATVQKRFKLK